MPPSQGDMRAWNGAGSAEAAAADAGFELAGTSKMQDPEDAPLFASGSPEPREPRGAGSSAAEEKAALSESKVDLPTARDLAERPIFATGSYQWEEELAQTRGGGAEDDAGDASGDDGGGGSSSSSTDYSDDFESDDEEERAKDNEARAREQRDLETVLSLCRQHTLDPSVGQQAPAATEAVQGAGAAAPSAAPTADPRDSSPRSVRLAQKEARLREQLGSGTFDQLFGYFVSQLT